MYSVCLRFFLSKHFRENFHSANLCQPTEATEEEQNENAIEEESDEEVAAKNKDMLGSVNKFSTTSMDEVIQVCTAGKCLSIL